MNRKEVLRLPGSTSFPFGVKNRRQNGDSLKNQVLKFMKNMHYLFNAFIIFVLLKHSHTYEPGKTYTEKSN